MGINFLSVFLAKHVLHTIIYSLGLICTLLLHKTINNNIFLLQAKDIIAIHEARCPKIEAGRKCQISSDGVSECRSNSNSIDVYSVRFKNCQHVYPHTITRPVDKYKLDSKPYLQSFIDDIKALCEIETFVGDNLKRANARGALNHASNFACEYCFAKATSFHYCDKKIEEKRKELELQISVIERRIDLVQTEEEIDQEELKTLKELKSCLINSLSDVSKVKKKVVWPSSTMNGEPRTVAKILAITNMIEENGPLPPDEAKGIIYKSPLLEIENFDMVANSPAEYLHSVCLGTTKRLLELTYNVGTTRPRVTKRKLTPVSLFNDLMAGLKGPMEFSRRIRSLDFAVWKGQEFRNLILFYFTIVIFPIERNAKERTLWLLLAYKIRACVLPSDEFHHVNLADIEYCCVQYYKLYEELFGPNNCSYNTHVVFSHLIEIRGQGPLTSTSAFGFESFYGEVRHSFCPGTPSPLKQVFEKVLLKRAIGHHSCSPPITLTTHETALECNNLVYTFQYRRYNM